MIIDQLSNKFGNSVTYLSNTYIGGGSGSATDFKKAPVSPRIPILNEPLPKVWRLYFDDMYKFLKNHIEDFQLHNRK